MMTSCSQSQVVELGLEDGHSSRVQIQEKKTPFYSNSASHCHFESTLPYVSLNYVSISLFSDREFTLYNVAYQR